MYPFDLNEYIISLMDIDGDGEKEFIMSSVYDGETLVLHRENDAIYGIGFWAKGIAKLQKSGLFMCSGGGHSSYRQLVFQNGMFVEEVLAERRRSKFYISGQEVSEAEIEEWENIYLNNEAGWYEIESRNISVLSAYDQLDVFAKNYKKWMIGKGDNYSYCIYDFGQDKRLELVVTVYGGDGVKNYFYQVDEEGIRVFHFRFYSLKIHPTGLYAPVGIQLACPNILVIIAIMRRNILNSLGWKMR